MTRSETAQLLARIVAFDRRTLGPTDVLAWNEALHDLGLDECITAVVQHFTISKDWLMPVDVRQHVKTLRKENLERAYTFVPDADPDDVPAYIAAVRTGRQRIAQGLEPRDMSEVVVWQRT